MRHLIIVCKPIHAKCQYATRVPAHPALAFSFEMRIVIICVSVNQKIGEMPAVFKNRRR
jgi:hypothetical protein